MQTRLPVLTRFHKFQELLGRSCGVFSKYSTPGLAKLYLSPLLFYGRFPPDGWVSQRGLNNLSFVSKSLKPIQVQFYP